MTENKTEKKSSLMMLPFAVMIARVQSTSGGFGSQGAAVKTDEQGREMMRD